MLSIYLCMLKGQRDEMTVRSIDRLKYGSRFLKIYELSALSYQHTIPCILAWFYFIVHCDVIVHYDVPYIYILYCPIYYIVPCAFTHEWIWNNSIFREGVPHKKINICFGHLDGNSFIQDKNVLPSDWPFKSDFIC